MTLVYAFDPGESTGWCTLTLGDDGTIEHLQSGWGDYKSVVRMHHRWMDAVPPHVVVIESWRLRAGKAAEFTGSPIIPIQAVGMHKAAVWLSANPDVPIVMQEPAVKRVINSILLERGAEHLLPATSDAEHARDAVRHALLWLVKNRSWLP